MTVFGIFPFFWGGNVRRPFLTARVQDLGFFLTFPELKSPEPQNSSSGNLSSGNLRLFSIIFKNPELGQNLRNNR
jgi:hypothetical protein